MFIVIVKEETNWPCYRELQRSPEFNTEAEAMDWKRANVQPSDNPYREVVIQKV